MRVDCQGKYTQGGFTLIEVLIALVIAALGISVMIQGSLGGLRAADISGRTQDALSRAKSRLAAIGQGSALAAGEQQGQDGPYRWRLRIAPLASRPAAPGQPVPTLYEVQVTIRWGEGSTARAVSLDTRRIGTAAPAAP